MSTSKAQSWRVIFSFLFVGVNSILTGLLAAALVGFFLPLIMLQLILPVPVWIIPPSLWPTSTSNHLTSPDFPVIQGAALAGLLVSLFFWWRVLRVPSDLSRLRGVLLGLFGSVLAHPLTWLLTMLLALIAGGKVPNSSQAMIGFPLILTAVSLFVVGWLTAAIGGVAGGISIWVYRAWVRVARSQPAAG